MAPQLAVQKTFIHLVDEDEEQAQPCLARSKTVPILIEDMSTDGEDSCDEPVCISREITFDAFDMPCNLCDGDACEGTARYEGEEWAQPQACRSTTFDPFEADVQDAWCVAPSSQPSLLAPQACGVGIFLPQGFPVQPVAPNMPAVEAPSQMVDQRHALAGVPPMMSLDQSASASVQQLAPDISCVYQPDGAVRMQWEADSRRFGGRAATAVSPAFSVDVPGLGEQTFKIAVHAAAATQGASKRSCSNFQAVGGHATIELKCESQVLDDTYVVVVDRAVGTRLGIDLESRTGEAWRVKAIGSGLVAQWNQEHPEARVDSGDSILEVNGVSGDLAKVREACTQHGALRLVLRRAGQAAPRFDVRFGIGGGAALAQAMRGPVRHDFAAESCCGLPAGDRVWDLLSAADRRAKKVRVVCELAQVQPLV